MRNEEIWTDINLIQIKFNLFTKCMLTGQLNFSKWLLIKYVLLYSTLLNACFLKGLLKKKKKKIIFYLLSLLQSNLFPIQPPYICCLFHLEQ